MPEPSPTVQCPNPPQPCNARILQNRAMPESSHSLPPQASREAILASREANIYYIASREAVVASREAVLASREANMYYIASREAVLASRQAIYIYYIASREAVLASREAVCIRLRPPASREA